MSRILKFKEATEELKKTIQDAKDKLLNKIISDESLSKSDRLSLISENNLFKVLPYMQDIFFEYQEEYIQIVKRNPVYQYSFDPTIDDYFHSGDYERHKTVNLSEIVEYIDEDDDELIPILKNRTTNDIFKISKYEFIDTIYNWCISNKAIGFKIDW